MGGQDDIHLVFSTDCGAYMGWQAELFAFSAMAPGDMEASARRKDHCNVAPTDPL